jgi:hypothetical protein
VRHRVCADWPISSEAGACGRLVVGAGGPCAGAQGRARGLRVRRARRSVFYLPKPRPLNYLVAERFAGPALVLQVCCRRPRALSVCVGSCRTEMLP